MKKNTKIVIIIAIIGIILLIRVLNITVTRSHSSISTVTASTAALRDSATNDTLQPPTNIDKPYTIVFHGIDNKTNPTAPNGECVIEVDVTENTTVGWQHYIPFYKPISIQSSIKYSWRNPMRVSGKDFRALETGQFDCEGSNTIFGIVSAKQAKQQTLALIHQHIRQGIISDIKSTLGVEVQQ